VTREKANNVAFIATRLIIFCLLLSGCSGSPLHTSKMSPTEIQSVDAEDLCYAYATYKRNYKRVPTIDGEVARRGLACKKDIESMVSNCTSLSIVNLRSEPIRLNRGSGVEDGTLIYATINNSGDKTKHFRVSAHNTSSSQLTIGSHATATYEIFVNKHISTISTTVALAQGTVGKKPSLHDCVTPR